MASAPLSLFFVLCVILGVSQVEAIVKFKNTCIDEAVVVPPPEERTSCGVLPFMNQTEFGNNAISKGILVAISKSNGVRIRIKLKNLSRPNLVLTAWLLYGLPFDPNAPEIFDYAYIASPLAATHAGFTSGLGREPNEFRYTSGTTARLDVDLDFNPTYPNEGPLGMNTFCNQKDIAGIENTAWRQGKIASTGIPYPNDVFVPLGSHYLRKFDDKTGFQKLDSRGRPVLVRSPVQAFAVAIAGHIDKTTHGISPGIFAGDHFEVMSFLLDRRVGRPTRRD